MGYAPPASGLDILQARLHELIEWVAAVDRQHGRAVAIIGRVQTHCKLHLKTCCVERKNTHQPLCVSTTRTRPKPNLCSAYVKMYNVI